MSVLIYYGFTWTPNRRQKGSDVQTDRCNNDSGGGGDNKLGILTSHCEENLIDPQY